MLRCTASCLLWSETRSAVLHHVYFGVRHAPPVLHKNALVFIVIVCECSSFLALHLALSFFTHILFRACSLVYWLALEAREKFRAYSDANGSLFILRHRILHVMLDFTMNLLIVLIS